MALSRMHSALAICSTVLLGAEGARTSQKRQPDPQLEDVDAEAVDHKRGRSSPGTLNFPEFVLPPTYTDPLSARGLETERRMMTSMDDASYQGFLETLADPRFGPLAVETRVSMNANAINAVRVYLEEEMTKTGAVTCTHTFTQGRFRPYEVHNIIGFVQGTEPGLVVLGAHYDSLPSSGKAPGAIDNGSGTAAVLSALKAFMASGAKPKKSIYFVAFGAEEQGFHGSRQLVREIRRHGSTDSPIPAACRVPSASEDTVGVTLDMIGWRNPSFAQDTVLIETGAQFQEVLLPLAQANQVLNGGSLKLLSSLRPFGSDHMSFLDNGFAGTLSIDNDGNVRDYRCYHRSCDDLSQVTYRLANEISKMNLGAVLRLAGLN